MDIKEKIEELRAELHRHNYNYYVLNAPEISDKEFDDKMRHEREIQLVHEAGAERKADEAAGVFRHEINGLGRHMLGGDGDVTLVFPIFVVDKNDHPALPDILHRFFNTANSHSIESSASLILRKSRFRAGIQPTVSPFSPPRRRGRGGEPSCGGHTCL